MHAFTYKEIILERFSNLLRVTQIVNVEKFKSKDKLEKETQIKLMIYPLYEN